jgi:dTDP-4-dehydrorhamnose reductase
MKTNKNILVVGARGMLGQAVYKYLKQVYPNTYGTHHEEQKGLLTLNADTLQKDFKKIIRQIESIDFIINCIGVLPSSKDKKNMLLVNTLFPKRLSYMSHKIGASVIHISSDAVFSSNSSISYENTKPAPDSAYGKSKLNGEVDSFNFLNIRTSIIGLDPINHKGLLEWTKSAKEINGYTNQIWTGCTTLQFAKICDFLIWDNNFKNVRNKSSIIHYAPLGPVTKYELITEFLKIVQSEKEVGKVEDEIMIDRELKSIYNILPGEKNLDTALLELVKFFGK